jgi:hypothetical protein
MSALLADKYAVRKYVADCGYPEILNELILHTENPEAIDFSKLPQSFVVKATHGSGWNIFVRNKNEIDPEEIVRQCNIWMGSVYGEDTNEGHYSEIVPSIIIEKFLFDTQYEFPIDYKFFVFHGVCHFIQVDYGRFSEHTRTFYNRNWEAQDFTFGEEPRGITQKAPDTLKKMIEISEVLARDIDFVRIDLYCINNKDIYFGEMTFAPMAGFMGFTHIATDYIMGSLW